MGFLRRVAYLTNAVIAPSQRRPPAPSLPPSTAPPLPPPFLCPLFSCFSMVMLACLPLSLPPLLSPAARATPTPSSSSTTNDDHHDDPKKSKQPNPAFLKERASKFDAIAVRQKERLAAKPKVEITVVLPDGTEKKGLSYETTPMDIAKVCMRVCFLDWLVG